MEIQIIQTTELNSESKTQKFATILNRILSNIKMIHWYIKDYNKHQIFGDLYTDLSDLFDSLQEEIIGTQRDKDLDFPEFDRDSTFRDEDFQNYLDDKSMVDYYFTTYDNIINVLLSYEFENYVKNSKSGILNTRDEIITRFNKTNYLINLTNNEK